MTKYNGPKIDLIIMAGHMQMLNWDAIQKMHLREKMWHRVAIWLVIGLMISLTISICTPGGGK